MVWCEDTRRLLKMHRLQVISFGALGRGNKAQLLQSYCEQIWSEPPLDHARISSWGTYSEQPKLVREKATAKWCEVRISGLCLFSGSFIYHSSTQTPSLW